MTDGTSGRTDDDPYVPRPPQAPGIPGDPPAPTGHGYVAPAPPTPSPPSGYPPPPPGYGPPAGYSQPLQAIGVPRRHGKAVAVLVLGIVSLVGLCFNGLGVVCAIIALALAPGARREIRQSQGMLTGEGLIRGGQTCAWISIVLVVVVLVFLVAVAVTSPQ